MANLGDFAKYVRPEVPGCPEIQIEDAIRRAGIEFCKDTKILRETVTVSTVADTARYDLTDVLATDTEPDDVLSVKRADADPLTASSEADFLAGNLDQPGSPLYFYLDGNDLVLGLMPDAVEDLEVLVKSRPTEDAATLPDVLYREYLPEIAAGAKSFLMLMDKQPWTNPQQAATYKTLFDAAVDRENLRYAKGGGAKRLRTVAHPF